MDAHLINSADQDDQNKPTNHIGGEMGRQFAYDVERIIEDQHQRDRQ